MRPFCKLTENVVDELAMKSRVSEVMPIHLIKVVPWYATRNMAAIRTKDHYGRIPLLNLNTGSSVVEDQCMEAGIRRIYANLAT
jgi:hypothetical protein